MKHALPATCCLLALLGACAAPAPSPERWQARERAELTRFEARLARSPQRIDDAPLQQYLYALISRIDATAAGAVRIYLLDRSAPQVDLVGGQILRIRTGLLAWIESESELVFVLAHELAHRRLGHVAAQHVRGWDASAAELAADLDARADLRRLGYDENAGAALLQRLGGALTDTAAARSVAERVSALCTAGCAAHDAEIHTDPTLDGLLRRYRNR